MRNGNDRSILHMACRYFENQREIYGEDLLVRQKDIFLKTDVKTDFSPLENFRRSIENCARCNLSHTRKTFVFGTGQSNASLMLIGEAPGRDEDIQGEPFVGQAGHLLEKILNAIGFEKNEVYICNILKCRPPGNRDPLPEEINTCLPYLKKQIELIKPRIILTLGRVSAQIIIETNDSLANLRGKRFLYNGISVIVTYHPAALLRNPEWKKFAWQDVKRLRALYDEIVRDKPKWQPLKP